MLGNHDDGGNGDHQMADSLSLGAFKEQLTIKVVRPFDLKKETLKFLQIFFWCKCPSVNIYPCMYWQPLQQRGGQVGGGVHGGGLQRAQDEAFSRS